MIRNAPREPSGTDNSKPALDRLLTALEVEVEVLGICEVRAGWRLAFEPIETPGIHFCMAGSGFLEAEGSERRRELTRDTIVITPARTRYAFASADTPQKTRLLDFSSPTQEDKTTLRFVAGGNDTEPNLSTSDPFITVCSAIKIKAAGVIDLFHRLKEPVCESFAEGIEGAIALRSTFEAVIAEIASPRLGTTAVIQALLKQAIILALRQKLDRVVNAGTVSEWAWLSSLADPRLEQALSSMIDDNKTAFKVEDLASIAGMSRSAFTESFSRAFGHPPRKFLRQLRLRQASRLLQATDMSVDAISSKIGYSSRSQFSRAFTAMYGVDPSSFRLENRSQWR